MICIIARVNWWRRVTEIGKKFLLMAKFSLLFLLLHSTNYWFEFNGYIGTYWNYGNYLLLVTLVTIRSAYGLANCHTGSFTHIDICDSLRWSSFVFGDMSLYFNLAKLCHFTARNVFKYVRAGAHCVSQHGILRGDFWELFTSEIFREVE